MYVVLSSFVFFFFKQKSAYEMRISDWSSDVCSSDLVARQAEAGLGQVVGAEGEELGALGDLGGPQAGTRQLDHGADDVVDLDALALAHRRRDGVDELAQHLELLLHRDQRAHALRSEEHTSKLQSRLRNSYAVFCLKK